jgi:hypothetical protein
VKSEAFKTNIVKTNIVREVPRRREEGISSPPTHPQLYQSLKEVEVKCLTQKI